MLEIPIATLRVSGNDVILLKIPIALLRKSGNDVIFCGYSYRRYTLVTRVTL